MPLGNSDYKPMKIADQYADFLLFQLGRRLKVSGKSRERCRVDLACGSMDQAGYFEFHPALITKYSNMATSRFRSQRSRRIRLVLEVQPGLFLHR